MTTYNTGNPIGSTDARDRLDNTENMDYLENSRTELTHPDRLGAVRKTRHGMEVEHDNQISAHKVEHDNQMQSFETDFDHRLAGMAFTRVGSFTSGATLNDMRQVLVWEVSQGGDGHEYGWAGTFPKVVVAGATPLASGGIGDGAWVDRTDVTLRSELAAASGISLVATNKFAIYVHSAPDDGVTDATSYFTSAATLSAENNFVQVVVRPPVTSYLLNSNPTIPDNVDIIADPSWFSGVGLLPVHAFMAESEGVDPRIYHAKDWHHSVTPLNNGERFWTGQHSVDIKHDQLYSGADSVKQDCVGHGTRAYVRGKNGRGWGGVDLVSLFASAIGNGATDTSAYGREIDVNNNAADINDFEVPGGPRCKGLIIASGGTKRPEEAIYVNSTSSGNRFLAALRWGATATEFGITPDEGFTGPVVNLPLSSKGIVGSYNRAEKATVRLSTDMSGWDFTGNSGGVAMHVDEDKAAVSGALLTRTTSMSESLSAEKTNCLYVTASMSVNTISGGYDGQDLTILVASGVVLSLNAGGNILLANGSNVGLAGKASIRFRREVGQWWQTSAAVGGLA